MTAKNTTAPDTLVTNCAPSGLTADTKAATCSITAELTGAQAGQGLTQCMRKGANACVCVCVYFAYDCNFPTQHCLEETERLLGSGAVALAAGLHGQHVEADSLGQGAALADGDDITLLHSESRGQVSGQGGVALLETAVLGHEVKVITSDDQGAVHLGGDDDALQNAATDGHVPGEGALLVDVGTLDGLLGGLDAQADVADEAGALLVLLVGQDALLVLEDSALLLVGGLMLSVHG